MQLLIIVCVVFNRKRLIFSEFIKLVDDLVASKSQVKKIWYLNG